jgi:hypothetical protein
MIKFLRVAFIAVAIALTPFSARSAETLKILGQVNPSATTLTTLYTVPASTSTVISTIVVANEAGSSASFRLSIQPACATVDPKHYIAYDTALPANDSIIITLGITLATTDCVRVYASASTVSFNAFGSEVQ